MGLSNTVLSIKMQEDKKAFNQIEFSKVCQSKPHFVGLRLVYHKVEAQLSITIG